MLAFLGDAAKGALPAGVGLLVEGRAGGYLLGVAAVIGHVFPVTRRFKGGRGVATAAGMILVLHPLVALALVAVWLLVGRVLRRASVASLLCAVALPVLVWLSDRAGWEVGLAAALALLDRRPPRHEPVAPDPRSASSASEGSSEPSAGSERTAPKGSSTVWIREVDPYHARHA